MFLKSIQVLISNMREKRYIYILSNYIAYYVFLVTCIWLSELLIANVNTRYRRLSSGFSFSFVLCIAAPHKYGYNT